MKTKLRLFGSTLAVVLAMALLLPDIFTSSVAANYTNNAQAVFMGEAALGKAPLQKIPDYSQSEDESAFLASTTVTMDRSRTKASIVAMAKALPHSGFGQSKVTAYSVAPVFTPPYAPGSLASSDITDALNALKMVRYIAGLPYESVAFTNELNNISQHGAVLMAASNQFGHTPSQPIDMSDSFFELGYQGCNEANISAGVSNISSAVLGFMADPGDNNIERAGHRRWILKPGGQNFGIGYARKVGSSYQGDRISMHVFDGPGYWECEADTYIAWPSSGDFPIQYFIYSENINITPPYPWSINLGAAYAVPNRNDITLTLTRRRDNKVWTFNSSTPKLGEGNMPAGSMHLAVDNSGYGITKAIIFRPDLTSLGAIKDGDIFDISLSGIKTAGGASTTLSYSINFFDLQKAMTEITTEITPDKDSVMVDDSPFDPKKTEFRHNETYKVTFTTTSGNVITHWQAEYKADRKDEGKFVPLNPTIVKTVGNP